jgi:nucleoside-diphosphate-sugar epimerase
MITGANGFLGKATMPAFLDAGIAVRAGVRDRTRASRDKWPAPAIAGLIETVEYGEIGPSTDWSNALQDVDCIVHLAARAHIMHERAFDPLAEFRRINVAGSLNLARQAIARGVKRLVFISSIKVNGERTTLGRPFTPDDPPAPTDPYGVSKLEAERGLRELERHGDLDVVVVRPVLVYGPGVKGNFRKLMRVLSKGIPLPFGGLNNRRSLVGVGNLADLLVKCARLEAAAHATFLVSDGEDLSTTELLRRLGALLGHPATLLSVPPSVLEWTAWLLRQSDLGQRLYGTLQVDSSKTCELLGWAPPFSVDQELRRTATSFLADGGGR